MLLPDQCLVFLEQNQSFPVVPGSVRIANVLRTFQNLDGNQVYEVQILTGSDGSELAVKPIINVLSDKIVSNLMLREITSPTIYQSQTQSGLLAKNFGDKLKERPLSTTSYLGFGTGLYGIYMNNPYKFDSKVAEIKMMNPFVLQDESHDYSFSIASLSTNVIVDQLIVQTRSNNYFDLPSLLASISDNEYLRLLTLWNIVFLRYKFEIDMQFLKEILSIYIYDFFYGQSYVFGNQSLFPCPTNYMMNKLNFDGVISLFRSIGVSYSLNLANQFLANIAVY